MAISPHQLDGPIQRYLPQAMNKGEKCSDAESGILSKMTIWVSLSLTNNSAIKDPLNTAELNQE